MLSLKKKINFSQTFLIFRKWTFIFVQFELFKTFEKHKIFFFMVTKNS